MGKTRAAYPPEFRRQMVELVRAGRSPEELAREFEPTAQSIRNWLAQCERNASRGDGGKSGRKSTSGSKIKNTDPVYARNSAEMRIFPSAPGPKRQALAMRALSNRQFILSSRFCLSGRCPDGILGRR
jgi:transposase-like protein